MKKNATLLLITLMAVFASCSKDSVNVETPTVSTDDTWTFDKMDVLRITENTTPPVTSEAIISQINALYEYTPFDVKRVSVGANRGTGLVNDPTEFPQTPGVKTIYMLGESEAVTFKSANPKDDVKITKNVLVLTQEFDYRTKNGTVSFIGKFIYTK